MGNAASVFQSLLQSPEDRLFGYLQAIRHVMDDPTVEKPTPSVSGALLEACFVSLRDMKHIFESKLTFSKRKYVLILQNIVLKNRKGEQLDGICIILDVLERLREYDNIVLEATAVLTSILSVPEGAASVDRQRGKQILQLCMKRWKDDEFIPFEAEYALKQLKAQQSAIKQLSQNALKEAIKVQSLKQIFIMLDSNSKNKNVALPCIVGILKIVDNNDEKLQELRKHEDWYV